MAASHTQPKCCLLYFNPVDSPLSAVVLLVLHQRVKIKKAEGVFSSHLYTLLLIVQLLIHTVTTEILSTVSIKKSYRKSTKTVLKLVINVTAQCLIDVTEISI